MPAHRALCLLHTLFEIHPPTVQHFNPYTTTHDVLEACFSSFVPHRSLYHSPNDKIKTHLQARLHRQAHDVDAHGEVIDQTQCVQPLELHQQ